jgi:hypothetical protein
MSPLLHIFRTRLCLLFSHQQLKALLCVLKLVSFGFFDSELFFEDEVGDALFDTLEARQLIHCCLVYCLDKVLVILEHNLSLAVAG